MPSSLSTVATRTRNPTSISQELDRNRGTPAARLCCHDARIRLGQRPELLEGGTNSVLWAILDQVVDGYGPVVAELERDIEEIERTVFAGSVAPTERI